MERRFILNDNGLQIPGVLNEPEYCTVRRCIIGVHGICGSKDSKVLEDIAEEMGLFGAATVRFDLPAHGDSPETDCCFYTCETQPILMKPSYFLVLYPNDLHRPGVCVNSHAHCRKVVIKIKCE